MRDYSLETQNRVAFIRKVVESAGADGVVFANSGGKDCVLTGALCKLACDNTVGLILPCGSTRNYGSDKEDAEAAAKRFGIESRYMDLAAARDEMLRAAEKITAPNGAAVTNVAPRLRMNALYIVAASENRLVAGTGNRSERYVGYFTKWGDGACDFNPISDLTVTEVYAYLRYLGAPDCVIDKAPSAGLYDGQTDEGEMGVTYRSIDGFLTTGEADPRDAEIIKKRHSQSEHKRRLPYEYKPI